MMPSSGRGAQSPGASGSPSPQRHPGATPPPPGSGQYPPRPQQTPPMGKGYPPQAGGPSQSNSYNGPPMYSGAMMATPGANVLNLVFDLTDVMGKSTSVCLSQAS